VQRVATVKADTRSGTAVSDPSKNARLARFQKVASQFFTKLESLLKALPAIHNSELEPELNIITALVPKAHVNDVSWLFTIRGCAAPVIDWSLFQYNARVAEQDKPILTNYVPVRPIPTHATKPTLQSVNAAQSSSSAAHHH
jgi:hypothetical protein